MRLLFVTSSLASHHHSMVAFGWAALAAGHEVQVATTPDLVPAVAGTGLAVVPVGPPVDFEDLHRRLRERVAREGIRYDPKLLFCAVAETMAAPLVRLARSWRPDVVVWDPASLAAPLAAQSCGAVPVRYLWGIDLIGRGSTPAQRLPAEVAEMYRRAGLELSADPPWWTFDPTPPSTWPSTGGLRRPVRYVPFSPDTRPPGWIYEPSRRPRVCVTYGLGITAKEYVGGAGMAGSPVLRAALNLGYEVVLAVGAAQRDQVGRLPARVRAVSSCPLSALLPTCAAVVHHGGNGTLLTAALAGVAQLVIPHMPDTRYSAECFVPTGALRQLAPDQATVDTVGAALTDLVDGAGYAGAARALRAEMLDQPAPAALVEHVQDLVGLAAVSS